VEAIAARVAVCATHGPQATCDEDCCCQTCGQDLIVCADEHSADMLMAALRAAAQPAPTVQPDPLRVQATPAEGFGIAIEWTLDTVEAPRAPTISDRITALAAQRDELRDHLDAIRKALNVGPPSDSDVQPGISPERHEELKSRAAAKAAEGGSKQEEESYGLNAVGPEFMDLLRGDARVNWKSMDLEFTRSTAKPALSWDEHERRVASRQAAVSGAGSGIDGASLGTPGVSPISISDVREGLSLLREIRDFLKGPKQGSTPQGSPNKSGGFLGALPPAPSLLPSVVPPLKGPKK
jgi:hypothetical protein